MVKSSFIVSIAALVFLVFGANSTFAQCGLPGTPPCLKKNTSKKTTPKKTTTKSTASKPTTKKSQSKFVPQAPKIELIKIPAGSFMMGGDKYDDEKLHPVNISQSFYIGKYEVTQAQWKAVMGNNPSYFSNCGSDCPVEEISWNDAQDFIRKLNNLQSDYKYRLPTEAEWEYACRAGTTGDYYGNPDSIAWYEENSDDKTHPMGRKSPNAWGLYDMSGNVWEWCQDWNGTYSSGAVTDPIGPSSGSNRIVRGGSFSDTNGFLRSAYRDNGRIPTLRRHDLGFRLVRQ